MDELKNLVIQTLETNGILGQIRAKLRSSVFKVIDNNDPSGKEKAMHWENPLAEKVLETTESALAADLIREYLEFYRLDYTLSIMIPEANLKQDPMDRDALLKKADMEKDNQNEPLLVQILKERKAGGSSRSAMDKGDNKPSSNIQNKEESKATKFSSNTGLTKPTPEPAKEPEHKNPLQKQSEKPKTSPKEKSGKKDDLNDYDDDFEDDDIEEMLPVEDVEDQDNNDNKMFSESGQFTGSQSMGMDPSVNTLAMDEYDHVEEVVRMD